MIRVLSDLLLAILRQGADDLSGEPYKHPVIIGSMYEGLAGKVLDQALPTDLDLRVVKGVISICGSKSGEMDCMVVEGDGHRIPNTDLFDYPLEQVIAIIESKKTYGRKEQRDAFRHFSDFARLYNGIARPRNLCDDAAAGLLSYRLSAAEAKPNLNPFHEKIFRSILLDSVLPARIILGFNSWSKHSSLRKAFVDDAFEVLPDYGFPETAPDLVVAENNSVIKLNGMPFGVRATDQIWHAFASTDANPLYLLLQLLWTRLMARHGVRDYLFADDRTDDKCYPLMFLECSENSITIHGDVGNTPAGPAQDLPMPFGPREISETLLNQLEFLGAFGELDLGDDEIQAILTQDGRSLQENIENLIRTGFVFVHENKLVLLTKKLETVINPSGKHLAGENVRGRVTIESLNKPVDGQSLRRGSSTALHLVLDNPRDGNVIAVQEIDMECEDGEISPAGIASFLIRRQALLDFVRENLLDEDK